MSTKEIRQKYLDFFAANGHAIVPSASLLPENDPTTLFTGSGMQPMVPYLLGQPHPRGTRIADTQKSFRSQDIDEIGDNRHTTFFEMLGNWSLGDYFKKEQISWMFEFLTKELKLDPNNLYFTCFRGNESLGIPRDEEAAGLWQSLLEGAGVDARIVDFPERDGMQDGRIFYYDEKKNWWSRAGVPSNMPVGEPGGPDTEMFWDFGALRGLHEQSPWKNDPCHVNCDCGRFMEIGNNVFMEYVKTETGFEKLKQLNVDFGGGLERMAAAVNNDPDIFLIDLFTPIREIIEGLSQKKYGQVEEHTKAFRVIMDHLRAATFLIADGAVPGNKDQGYFTRRLIRRSVRFAHALGIQTNFCASVADTVIRIYEGFFPEIDSKKSFILGEIEKEEVKFRRTLALGLKVFEEMVSGKNSEPIVSGKEAFDLYQSYGFPIEMTEEIAAERQLMVDKEAFNEEVRKHQDLSRQGAEKKFKGGLLDHSDMSVKYHTATHLLHAALRKVLGPQAEQRGSNITPERLRFDFVHSTKMTQEEIKQTEDLVNAAIARDYPMTWAMLTLEDAKGKGAIGLFEEKYGEQVKVYTVGDPGLPAEADPNSPTFSREFCGGPHVERTGILGKFKIVKEEACSAGIRRIKAILE